MKFKASLKVSKSVIFLWIGAKEFYQTFKMRVFAKTNICSKNKLPDMLAHFFFEILCPPECDKCASRTFFYIMNSKCATPDIITIYHWNEMHIRACSQNGRMKGYMPPEWDIYIIFFKISKSDNIVKKHESLTFWNYWYFSISTLSSLIMNVCIFWHVETILLIM